jgi:plasmid maintenance system antidote protein VapI
MDVTVTLKSRMGTKNGALKLHQRARALGVSSAHLSQVISGKRNSTSLLIRLGEMIEAEAKTKTNEHKPTI